MDLNKDVRERNVKTRDQRPLLVQQIQKQRGNSHLQQRFLDRCQAKIPLESQLRKIIQKTHKSKAQRQCKNIKNGVILHGRNADQQAKDQTEDEHQTAHHRCSCFVIVPGRANFTNGLPRLQRPQHRQYQKTDEAGQHGGCRHRNQYSCHFTSPDQASFVSNFSTAISICMP